MQSLYSASLAYNRIASCPGHRREVCPLKDRKNSSMFGVCQSSGMQQDYYRRNNILSLRHCCRFVLAKTEESILDIHDKTIECFMKQTRVDRTVAKYECAKLLEG